MVDWYQPHVWPDGHPAEATSMFVSWYHSFPIPSFQTSSWSVVSNYLNSKLLIFYKVSCYLNPISRLLPPSLSQPTSYHSVTLFWARLWSGHGERTEESGPAQSGDHVCTEWAPLANSFPTFFLTFSTNPWGGYYQSPFYSWTTVASRTTCPRCGGARAEPLPVWPRQGLPFARGCSSPALVDQKSSQGQQPTCLSSLVASISHLGSNTAAAVIHLTTTFFWYLNEVVLLFFPSLYCKQSYTSVFQKIFDFI